MVSNNSNSFSNIRNCIICKNEKKSRNIKNVNLSRRTILPDFGCLVFEKIFFKNRAVETEYILIVNGDVDGNGTADIYDMIKINNYRISQKGLTEYEKIAADVEEDGEIGIYDIIRINNYRITGKGL